MKMQPPPAVGQKPWDILRPKTREFYLRALDILDQSAIRYVLGGAYALSHYAGIVRHTKDLDVFVKPDDMSRVLSLFEQHGYRTEITHPHWVAKAFEDDDFVDVIYGSGNGQCPVDEEWLKHAVAGEVLGRAAPLCPPEEILWSKSFVKERDRYDGADIDHLLLSQVERLDWRRLLRRFQGHEAVLLSELILFGYVYPSERERVPAWVLDELMRRARSDATDQQVCRGTLLSWSQYLMDVRERGLKDARLAPIGNMTAEQVDQWTRARK